MDYTTIRSVNDKYIFIKVDGKEDRTPTKKADLSDVLESFNNDYNFYNRMVLETEKTKVKINLELGKLLSYEKQLENIIEENKNDPLYRRGLADACFNLEYTGKKIHETLCKLSGVSAVVSDAMHKRDKAERMTKEILNALKSFS